MKRWLARIWAFGLALAWGGPGFGAGATVGSARQVIPLEGAWEFQREGTNQGWKTVTLPASWEAHEGVQFDGAGRYRREITAVSLPRGRRCLLEFQAAATEAEVWWNGERLGSHLGGWTPFRFDVTELVRRAPAGQAHQLMVRLDEKVGHNTQGFLPIVAPHFGGLWQAVRLLIVPEVYLDDLRLLARGDPASGLLEVEVPAVGSPPAEPGPLSLRCRGHGWEDWKDLSPQTVLTGGVLRVRAPVPTPRLWSPATPNLYEVEVGWPGPLGDRVLTRAAFRAFEVYGAQFRLNGQPVAVRGLLNWGYSPPLVAPNPGEAAWRRELELARSHGFNLMKFCLWVPPRRYLELADELGMLTWMEYPTWHPTLTEAHWEALRREFSEFFYYDRNHPSVVLRSLTCETGPGAELPVIQRLYDLAHAMIPGAVVEDDSSWIGWNRVHDFYDDHPYGNNHTWVQTLRGFNEHILAHGAKPMALGEAMAADTWLDRPALLERLGNERPFWAPGPLDELPRWLERVPPLAGGGGEAALRADSLRYGLLMRKYQVEAYRREVPYGAYVISVLRDIPKASMGLIDYLDQPKWRPADWVWQRDTQGLLRTDGDRRSFASGETLRADLLVSHFGPRAFRGGKLEVVLEEADGAAATLQRLTVDDLRQNAGTLASVRAVDWPLPEVVTPKCLTLRATLLTPEGEFRNQWSLWVVPRSPELPEPQVRWHDSIIPELARELSSGPATPGAPILGRPTGRPATNQVLVTARFDDAVVQWLEQGGRVLCLPDGQTNSFPLEAHWFLRGAPYVPEHPLHQGIPRAFYVELQHFDLASSVVPGLPYLADVDPVLLLWDTHDLKTVKNHGLVFETRVGPGRLLVSALRHQGHNNAAGHWLFHRWLAHLAAGPEPRAQVPAKALAYWKSKLHAEQLDLTIRRWRFRPDPREEGLKEGWHLPARSDQDGWVDIRVGEAWEGQGFPTLDHWAWYRLTVPVPAAWQGRDIYLSFEGVDDMYELYVNGQLVARCGDMATRKDTFNEKRSHRLNDFLTAGRPALIAVRVYDWYGAGGIFRPVTLGTLGFSPGLDWLR